MFVGRTYSGGSAGANYGLIKYEAASKKKRYFAIARADTDGHGFIFDRLDDRGYPNGDMQLEGCERPCADDPSKYCGCTDMACTGPRAPGEEHNRRWVVYEMVGMGKKGGGKKKKKGL